MTTHAPAPAIRLLAIVVALATTALLFLATPATATTTAPRWKHCGHVPVDIRVLARGTSCDEARSVARAHFEGHRNPHGYTCHRVPVQAGAGFYVKCRKGSAHVEAIPE